jgi:hypothetical protein
MMVTKNGSIERVCPGNKKGQCAGFLEEEPGKRRDLSSRRERREERGERRGSVGTSLRHCVAASLHRYCPGDDAHCPAAEHDERSWDFKHLGKAKAGDPDADGRGPERGGDVCIGAEDEDTRDDETHGGLATRRGMASEGEEGEGRLASEEMGFYVQS